MQLCLALLRSKFKVTKKNKKISPILVNCSKYFCTHVGTVEVKIQKTTIRHEILGEIKQPAVIVLYRFRIKCRN